MRSTTPFIEQCKLVLTRPEKGVGGLLENKDISKCFQTDNCELYIIKHIRTVHISTCLPDSFHIMFIYNTLYTVFLHKETILAKTNNTQLCIIPFNSVIVILYFQIEFILYSYICLCQQTSVERNIF